MNARHTLCMKWFLIACTMVLTIILAPAVHAVDPIAMNRIDDFAPAFDRPVSTAPVERIGQLTRVEDPPDLLRTAVVPGSAASAGYAPSQGYAPSPNYGPATPWNGGAAPNQFGNPNYGPQAPASTFPLSSAPPNWNSTSAPPAWPTAPSHQPPVNPNPGYYAPTAPGAGYPNPNGYQPPAQYQASPAQYQAPAKPSDAEQHNNKITARYQDSTYLAFLSRANMNQLTSLYIEASNLIDTRHVNPTSYEVRNREAINGLIGAINNPAFQQANGINVRPDQIQAFQSDLSQFMNQQGPRTAQEAVGIMQWVGETANRRLGLRREVVAMEFLSETLDSLDKYSSFIPNKTAMTPSASIDGLTVTAALEESVVGIGVELKTHEQGALIMGTVDGGPAAALGLKKGDILVQINGQELAGMPLSQVADRIAGQAGSQLTINIRRNGQRYAATLVRRSVYVSSVSGTTMIENSNVGYIRLKQFSESSTKDLETAMSRLRSSGMQALVLDLRGNPGGLLTQSVTVSDLFLTQGTIVSTRGRTQSDNSSESARFEQTWDIPLVVLVDDNSASASEIFAAAIQDNRRGVLVGRKSYGKGTVQTHFPVQSASGVLKLTTAKFYAPSGREMAGQGVTPDVPVNNPNADTAASLWEDADILAALQTIQSGTPNQLAASSTGGANPARPAANVPGSGQPNYFNQLFNTAPNYQNGPTGYQSLPAPR
jgi:carboxyl-terminal processing protease